MTIPLIRLPGAPRLAGFSEPPIRLLSAALHQSPVVALAPSLDAVALHLAPEDFTGVILVAGSAPCAIGPMSWLMPLPSATDLAEILRLASVVGHTRREWHARRQLEREAERLRAQCTAYDASVQHLTKARANLRLAHDRLLHQELALREARDRALAGDRAKTTFLATMSHELRTPLNGILGMADILKSQVLTMDQTEEVDIIHACGSQLLELVNELLLLSSADAGFLRVSPIAMDPLTPLEDLTAAIAVQAELKGLSVMIEPGPNLPTRVFGDPVRIRQTIAPLVSNSLKFTEHGWIIVSAHLNDEGTIRYAVRDSGPGIESHLAARLFAPFVQGETYETRQHGGTGLGLSIAQRLAQLQGGSIALQPAGRQPGAHFTVDLPLPILAPVKTASPTRPCIELAVRDPQLAATLTAIVAHLGIPLTGGAASWLITDELTHLDATLPVVFIGGPRQAAFARTTYGGRLHAAGLASPAFVGEALSNTEIISESGIRRRSVRQTVPQESSTLP